MHAKAVASSPNVSLVPPERLLKPSALRAVQPTATGFQYQDIGHQGQATNPVHGSGFQPLVPAATGTKLKHWPPKSDTAFSQVKFAGQTPQQDPAIMHGAPQQRTDPDEYQHNAHTEHGLRKLKPDKHFQQEMHGDSESSSSGISAAQISKRRKQEAEILSRPRQEQPADLPIQQLNSTIEKLTNAVTYLQEKFEPKPRERPASRNREGTSDQLDRFRSTYGSRRPHPLEHQDQEVIDLTEEDYKPDRDQLSSRRLERPKSGNMGDYWEDNIRGSSRRPRDRPQDDCDQESRSRSPEPAYSRDPLNFDPYSKQYRRPTNNNQRINTSVLHGINNIPFQSATQDNSYMPGFQQAQAPSQPWNPHQSNLYDSQLNASAIYEPSEDHTELDLSVATAEEQLENLIHEYQRHRSSTQTGSKLRDRIVKMQKVIASIRDKQARMRGARKALRPVPAVPLPDEQATLHPKQIEHIFANQSMTASQVMRTFRNFFMRHRGTSATMNEALMMALPADAKDHWQNLYQSMPTEEAILQMMQRYCIDSTPADLRAELSALKWQPTDGPLKVCMSKWEGIYHQLCMASYSLVDRNLKEHEKMNAIFTIIPAKWVRKLQSKQLKAQAKGKILTTTDSIQLVDRWRYEEHPEQAALDKASDALTKLSVNNIALNASPDQEISVNSITSLRDRGRSKERRDRYPKSSSESIRSKSRERLAAYAKEARDQKLKEARSKRHSDELMDAEMDEIMRHLPTHKSTNWPSSSDFSSSQPQRRNDDKRQAPRSSSADPPRDQSRGRSPYRSSSKYNSSGRSSRGDRSSSSNRNRSNSRDWKNRPYFDLPYRKNGWNMSRVRSNSKEGVMRYVLHAELDVPQKDNSKEKQTN